MRDHIYIASHDVDGGILHCVLNEGGTLEFMEKYPLDKPAYLCQEGGTLYALLREPFMQQSGIVHFEIKADGRLGGMSAPEPTHGTVGAHITAFAGKIFCANYLSGSLTLMPDRLAAFSGRGTIPDRQDCSHPHCVQPTPDGRFICVCDLGTDRIYVLTPELSPVSELKLPDGSGPRHLVFSLDGKHAFCSNELSSCVTALEYFCGKLRLIETLSSLPEPYAEGNSASAIRISKDGSRLYVSNRGHGSVSEFAVSGGKLRRLGAYCLPGASLREINLCERFLLCADEDSDCISVFDIEKGYIAPPVSRFNVRRPWCILPCRKKDGG